MRAAWRGPVFEPHVWAHRIEIWLPVALEPSVNSLPLTSQTSASGDDAAGRGGAQRT